MKYPDVLGEEATLDLILSGRSIARYGDGEFKICWGSSAKSQVGTHQLQRRLCDILRDSGSCLVGIPNIHSATPKAVFWRHYLRAGNLLIDRSYVSSFVTRPDSAPWIDTPSYWAKVESLWLGQDVTLVRGSGKSFKAEDLVGAGAVTEILAPRQHAWAEYGALLKRIGTPSRALLCLGATATVMAVDLCARGVHAIDIGHLGLFYRKVKRGEPCIVQPEDKLPHVDPA